MQCRDEEFNYLFETEGGRSQGAYDKYLLYKNVLYRGRGFEDSEIKLVSEMSNRGWALLGLAVILIVAGPSALTVLGIAVVIGLLEMAVRLLVYVLKLIFRWVFR
ncbi:MAG: hypothetical protein H6Q69_140 [Firmicutes bacterium]|nr:hypothetical protein [Bacillota bacterium]MBP2657108.1 hypothetical protein [Bacillota bacterium]